jgi:tetratricopeptide (TPR) repeat protein
VYPWFGENAARVSVHAFLLDRGQHQTRVVHERLELELVRDYSAWVRAWAGFRLSEAMASAGELAEARMQLQEAIALIESPDVDDDARVLGLSKFLMQLGHVQAALGELNEAQATYQRAVEFDRRTHAAGGVIGALSGALIGLLQLADLHAQSDRPDGQDQAQRICSQVYNEATQTGDAHIAVMALERLARLFVQTDPPYALERVQQARQIGAGYPEAFAGRQGARYARMLAETAANMAYNGEPALDDAHGLFCVAIGTAGRAGAQQELGHALYQLGNLFESYHLLDLAVPFSAAWACYALADACTQETEGGSPLNAQFRIDQRIAPRIDESERATVAAAVATDPWGLIDAALHPHALGWRP